MIEIFNSNYFGDFFSPAHRFELSPPFEADEPGETGPPNTTHSFSSRNTTSWAQNMGMVVHQQPIGDVTTTTTTTISRTG